jgi:hypothetical protein
MSWMVSFAGLLLAGFCLHAQDVPSGWKVVKDKKGTCQMAVPADWVTDKLLVSNATSPDNKSSAVVHGASPDQSFAEATDMVKQVIKPAKILEDSGKRLRYVYEGNGSAAGATNWYAAVPGKPVCTMQVTFRAPVLEETAKKIIMSEGPAK